MIIFIVLTQSFSNFYNSINYANFSITHELPMIQFNQKL